MKAMIFAAGLGTRLKPLTDSRPKALVPVAGRPLLQWQIERLKAFGITDIIINVHHFGQQIIDFLKAHSNFGCSILVSDERDELLDTGGGLYKAIEDNHLNEPILAVNVDILSTLDYPTLINEPLDIATLVVSDRKTQRYLCFDEAGELKGWTNIATGALRNIESTDGLRLLAFSGTQVVSPAILPYMAAMGKKVFSLVDLYLTIPHGVRAFVPIDYTMIDVGKLEVLGSDKLQRMVDTVYRTTTTKGH